MEKDLNEEKAKFHLTGQNEKNAIVLNKSFAGKVPDFIRKNETQDVREFPVSRFSGLSIVTCKMQETKQCIGT